MGRSGKRLRQGDAASLLQEPSGQGAAGGGEDPHPSAHPLIARVEVQPLDGHHVTGLCSIDPDTLRRELSEHAQAAVLSNHRHRLIPHR